MPALSCVLTRIVVVPCLPSVVSASPTPPGAEDKNLTPAGPGGYPPSKFVFVCIAFSFRLVRFLFAASLISCYCLEGRRNPASVRLGPHRVLLSSRYFQRLACLQFHGRETGWESITRPNFLRAATPQKNKPEPASLKARFRLVSRLLLCHHTQR